MDYSILLKIDLSHLTPLSVCSYLLHNFLNMSQDFKSTKNKNKEKIKYMQNKQEKIRTSFFK